jgi:FkbM family methyltransferase
MNLSGISSRSLPGRLLRLPLRMIPPETRLPIVQGRLRGKRWIVGSSTHGCWLGSYEYKKRRLFERTVGEGDVVYDVGANVGFYTLLAAVLTGSSGHVVAFEPVPRNLRFLREHVRMNRVPNVTIIEAAVAERAGTASFDEGPNPSMGQLAGGGALEVRTVTLDDLVSLGQVPPPVVVKVDIEGGEVRALLGAQRTLSEHQPAIFLSTHGPEPHTRCRELLVGLGYEFRAIGAPSLNQADEILARPAPGNTRTRGTVT